MACELIVLGSSSRGNGYALSAGGEILLIEAGVKFKAMLKGIDYALPRVVGCIVSHAHGDHSRHATEYARYGVPIIAGRHVAERKEIPAAMLRVAAEGNTLRLGGFSVTPFGVPHDVPNFGYLIYRKGMGTLLFATDTFVLPYSFEGVSHFLIEANYDDSLLEANVASGLVDRRQADRLMVSHMSLANCVENLRQCHAGQAENIVLIHLSERNSSAEAFRRSVAKAFGVPTYIAEKGKTINLSTRT